MLSTSAALDLVANILGYFFLVALLALAFRYKLWRQITFLFVYVIFLVPREAIWLVVEHSSLFGTMGAIYFYHLTAFTLTILRMFVIAEIAWRVLRDYPAIRKLMWLFLSVVGVLLLSWSADAIVRNPHFKKSLIITLQQRLDITLAVLLLLLMIIGVYYSVRIIPLYRFVLIGSCVYSAVQIANMELGRLTANPGLSVFDFVQRFTFVLMFGIWTWAVWRWAAITYESPVLIPQQVYNDLSPRVHDRLRELNDRLTSILSHGG